MRAVIRRGRPGCKWASLQARPKRPEEGADVLHEGGRLLHGGEVAPRGEAGPAPDLEDPLRPFPGRLHDLVREDGASGRHGYAYVTGRKAVRPQDRKSVV